MGFFDISKKVGDAVRDEVNRKAETMERHKQRFDRLDDESLIKKYQSTSGEEKLACAMLLKERGYGKE